MGHSLFLSPAFIFTESSFIFVALFAAYELLVGDFIWAKQQEEFTKQQREEAMQRRGRGYDTLESPGARGIGRPSRAGHATARGEEMPLVYPARSRGGNMPIREEGYYSSPRNSGSRYSSSGRGSSGDSTRRLFYKNILIALLSRFVLLPVETFCVVNTENNPSDQSMSPSNVVLSIILRFSESFPEVTFASALGLLVIFCAQIAFAAMPPSTPDSAEGSIHGDNDALSDGVARSGGEVGEGGIEGQENTDSAQHVLDNLKRNTTIARNRCTRLSRKVLASEKTYASWNLIIFASYALVSVTALAASYAPLLSCEIALSTLMVVMYAILLVALAYVGLLLWRALRPGIARRDEPNSLAIRLVVTCTLLAIMFMDRAFRFGSVVHHTAVAHETERVQINYRRVTIEYAISESLPVLLILILMHRKRKEMKIQSIVTFIGNMGRTASADEAMPSAPGGDGSSSTTAAESGLASSRRFQTYGGTRGDSFPPSSSNNSKRGMPRATSSSGGGAKSQHQVHQQQPQHRQQQRV